MVFEKMIQPPPKLKKTKSTKKSPPTLIIDFLLSTLLFKGQLFCKMCLKRTLSFSKFAVAIRLLYIPA